MTKTHIPINQSALNHPVVVMHSRRDLHIKAINTRIELAYLYSILNLKAKTII